MNFRLLTGLILGATLFLSLPATVNAQTFYFDGYGGFSDPAEISPTSPADGADDNTTVDFLPPFSFIDQSLFDTNRTAWHVFHWENLITERSHLSINELTPTSPPTSSTFADPYTGPIAADASVSNVVGWLIHHNEVIGGWFGPDNLSVHYHLDIYADPGKTELVWSSGPMDFTLDVMETINGGVDGVCLDNNGGTTGEDTGFSTPCPDRFRFAEGWPVNPSGSDGFDRTIGTFTYEDRIYRVSLSGFWDGGSLVGEAWSEEGDHNQFDVRARIDSMPVANGIPALPAFWLTLLTLLLTTIGLLKIRQAQE